MGEGHLAIGCGEGNRGAPRRWRGDVRGHLGIDRHKERKAAQREMAGMNQTFTPRRASAFVSGDFSSRVLCVSLRSLRPFALLRVGCTQRALARFTSLVWVSSRLYLTSCWMTLARWSKDLSLSITSPPAAVNSRLSGGRLISPTTEGNRETHEIHEKAGQLCALKTEGDCLPGRFLRCSFRVVRAFRGSIMPCPANLPMPRRPLTTRSTPPRPYKCRRQNEECRISSFDTSSGLRPR